MGVKKGDAVVIYLPMLMELPIAMLACARIGAVHSVLKSSTDLCVQDCVHNVRNLVVMYILWCRLYLLASLLCPLLKGLLIANQR